MRRKSNALPTVRIHDEVRDQLDQAAEDLGVSLGWIIRNALADWLGRYQREPQTIRDNAARNS